MGLSFFIESEISKPLKILISPFISRSDMLTLLSGVSVSSSGFTVSSTSSTKGSVSIFSSIMVSSSGITSPALQPAILINTARHRENDATARPLFLNLFIFSFSKTLHFS